MTDRIYNGNDLKDMGFAPGPHFGKVLDIINSGDYSENEVRDIVASHEPAPKLPLRSEPAPCVINLVPENEAEEENFAAVKATMEVLLRTPVVEKGAIMPDACPAGSLGTIPVGGVVAARNAILPGMHSADICCSLMATVFEDAEPKAVLDAVHKITHFGPGGRKDNFFEFPEGLKARMQENDFLNNGRALKMAAEQLGCQGDGNHFAWTGVMEDTGKTVLITHHGSRGVGAFLYKAGMKVAEKFRKKLSPETLKQNAWIPSKSAEGIEYWAALQLVREWTKLNHEVIHNATLKAVGSDIHDRHWNEHNFVFKEDEGDDHIIWHAKGATPIHNAFLPDTKGVQIVPMNMAEPILFIQGERTERNLGFAPHGAGRNMSRTKHKRALGERTAEEVFAEETKHIDARFFFDKIDVSELPSAYKNAASVQRDMEAFELAQVKVRALPYGSIMAGDWEEDAPWKIKAREKAAAKAKA